MTKCLICGRKTNNGTYCQEHQRAIDSEYRSKSAKPKAVYYIIYQGHVVGLYRHNGNLVPSYYGMSTARIPKSRLINLDTYIKGFDRKQIRRLKGIVLRLSK